MATVFNVLNLLDTLKGFLAKAGRQSKSVVPASLPLATLATGREA